MLGGDQGIIKQAVDAKDKTKEGQEIEYIKIAYNSINKIGEDVTKEELQEELELYVGEGNINLLSS